MTPQGQAPTRRDKSPKSKNYMLTARRQTVAALLVKLRAFWTVFWTLFFWIGPFYFQLHPFDNGKGPFHARFAVARLDAYYMTIPFSPRWFRLIRMVTANEPVHAKQLWEWKCDRDKQMCVQATQLVQIDPHGDRK